MRKVVGASTTSNRSSNTAISWPWYSRAAAFLPRRARSRPWPRRPCRRPDTARGSSPCHPHRSLNHVGLSFPVRIDESALVAKASAVDESVDYKAVRAGTLVEADSGIRHRKVAGVDTHVDTICLRSSNAISSNFSVFLDTR